MEVFFLTFSDRFQGVRRLIQSAQVTAVRGQHRQILGRDAKHLLRSLTGRVHIAEMILRQDVMLEEQYAHVPRDLIPLPWAISDLQHTMAWTSACGYLCLLVLWVISYGDAPQNLRQRLSTSPPVSTLVAGGVTGGTRVEEKRRQRD